MLELGVQLAGGGPTFHGGGCFQGHTIVGLGRHGEAFLVGGECLFAEKAVDFFIHITVRHV